MASAAEFREYARKCMDWARTARSEEERAIFLEMAQSWLASRLEAEHPKMIKNIGMLRNSSLGGADILFPECRRLFRPAVRRLCG
jgi:hypothetical protein